MVFRLNSRLLSILRLLPKVAFVACFACTASVVSLSGAETPSIAAAVQTYCIECHGQDSNVEGGIDLSSVSHERLVGDPELVRKLIEVLDGREMPPEEEPQPSDLTRRSLVSDLQIVLREAISQSGVHRRSPIRRMNRFQYNNAVVDLFQLNCIVFTLPERAMRVHRNYFDPASGVMPKTVAVGNRPLGKSQMIEPRLAGVAAFPQDLRAEHGYDNQADHLSLSPLLMEAFLKLGESITQSPDFNQRRVGIWDSFFAEPETKRVAAEVRVRVQVFLNKAFRGQVDEDTVDRYVAFATNHMRSGQSFTSAMKAVASAAIASPRFLYIYDGKKDNHGKASQAISDYDLATRLSFFLWGSLPDEELLALAKKGALHDRAVLSQQIDRMLADKKLKRFCDSFPSQWLQLDRIVSSIPNREKFPSFYFSKYRASMHMMMEPLLLFETVLVENQSITQLVDPDFTYRSGKLQQVYGELGDKSTGGGVTVLNFHRVPITDRRNGGVITNAAVMTMTSGPERTQPITRGAWVAGVIFNDPPDPPPADVPPLGEKPGKGEENMTLRERLAAHRERSDCRGCHEQIDPLGFALENYDPIGRWRKQYANGREIEVEGKLFRQTSYSSVVEFKDAIVANKDRFARAFAGHLMSFALARELGPADLLEIDRISEPLKSDGYKIQSLIRYIILSEPFRTQS